MSDSEEGTAPNAFAVLMGKTKVSSITQRRSSAGTQFIPCPAGCGKRMLEKDVNLHLDQCIGQSDEQQREATSQPQPLSQSQHSASDSGRIGQARSKGSLLKKRRVVCPACEKSFPTTLINMHLDQCVRDDGKQPHEMVGTEVLHGPLKQSQALPLDGDVVNDTASEGSPHQNTSVGAMSSPELAVMPNSNKDGTSEAENEIENESLSRPNADVIVPTTTNTQQEETAMVSQSPDNDQPSVFAKMMVQSKKAFAREKSTVATTLQQSFHLDANIGVKLNLRNTTRADQEWTRPSWSAIVNIKDKLSRDTDDPAAGPPLAFDLTLSSSIQSHDAPVRWVRRHSRLSVPVLKSIFQKAVRRRRPLPAVRVAMELADKSLGDLLRRLPVIVLEDSTLHPDMDFLMWIMMAHSKEFVPSPRLMLRVFQVVYEVASCQWSDPIGPEGEDEDRINGPATTLTSLAKSSMADYLSPSLKESILWSILLRAEYGGMRCDVRMLHTYAKIWNQRFETTSLPESVATRLGGSVDQLKTLNWPDVPTQIHRRAKEQGNDRVAAICSNGIDRLVHEDICVEGVDFHCSPVIDELLNDQQLCGICQDLMVLSSDSSEDIPVSAEGRRSWLEGMLKSCMWSHSSGVNLRRPLCSDQSASSTKDRFSELWSELIAPRALAYQKKYVEQRLAR
jgi:hypothetical protein